MKKYENVLQRVREIEYKRGISYAKTDGNLYKWLNVIFIIAYGYTMFINALTVLGCYLRYIDTEIIDIMKTYLNSLTVLMCLLTLGLVFICFKNYIFKIIGCLLTALPAIAIFISHYTMYDNNDLFFNLDSSGTIKNFVIKHVISLPIILFVVIWMMIIAIRANIKTDKLYKKVCENIYNDYRISADNSESLTDEQWDEILKNYNPHYKKSKIAVIEEDEAEENE